MLFLYLIERKNKMSTEGHFAFAIFFAILGLFLIFLHIPKNDRLKYYRLSRTLLGIAFMIMSGYCVVQPIIIDTPEGFVHTSMLAIFSLLFSWLNYGSYLLLVYTSKYKRRMFLLDGAIPIGLMCLIAVIGLTIPATRKIALIAYGMVFIAKCWWMAYTCFREYNNCIKDIDNYYDQHANIEWMRPALWATVVLSVVTLASFYIPFVQRAVSPILGVIVYTYIAFKLINYVPKRISKVRSASVESEEEIIRKAEPKKTDLKEKLEPIVSQWIQKKGYLRPKLTIKDVAMEIGTNQNYLSRYINQFEEKTFSVWLNTLRLEESKELLASPTKYSIEDVGKLVGIPESYNFSRWFKQITGTTPLQFRKDLRKA